MKVLIVPKDGLLIRDPKTKLILPSEGKYLILTSFWTRRKNDGDVTIGE